MVQNVLNPRGRFRYPTRTAYGYSSQVWIQKQPLIAAAFVPHILVLTLQRYEMFLKVPNIFGRKLQNNNKNLGNK